MLEGVCGGPHDAHFAHEETDVEREHQTILQGHVGTEHTEDLPHQKHGSIWQE